MLLNIENKSLNLNDVNDHNWYVNAQHHYVYTWICICNVTWQFHFVYRQMALQFYISILFVDKRLCNFTFPFCSSTNGFATLHFHFVHRQKAFATLHFHFVRRQRALQLYISILFVDKRLLQLYISILFIDKRLLQLYIELCRFSMLLMLKFDATYSSLEHLR